MFCPVFVIPPMLYAHLHLHAASTRRANRRTLGNFQKLPGTSRIFQKLPETSRIFQKLPETSRNLCFLENRGTLNRKLLPHGRYGVHFRSSLCNLSNLGGTDKRNEKGHVEHFYRASMHPSNNIWKLTNNKYEFCTVLQSTVLFNIDFWTKEPQLYITKLYTNEFSSCLGSVMSEWLILVQYLAIYILYS